MAKRFSKLFTRGDSKHKLANSSSNKTVVALSSAAPSSINFQESDDDEEAIRHQTTSQKVHEHGSSRANVKPEVKKKTVAAQWGPVLCYSGSSALGSRSRSARGVLQLEFDDAGLAFINFSRLSKVKRSKRERLGTGLGSMIGTEYSKNLVTRFRAEKVELALLRGEVGRSKSRTVHGKREKLKQEAKNTKLTFQGVEESTGLRHKW